MECRHCGLRIRLRDLLPVRRVERIPTNPPTKALDGRLFRLRFCRQVRVVPAKRGHTYRANPEQAWGSLSRSGKVNRKGLEGNSTRLRDYREITNAVGMCN